MTELKGLILCITVLLTKNLVNCLKVEDAKGNYLNKVPDVDDVHNRNEVKERNYCDITEEEVNEALSSLFMVGNENIEIAYNNFDVFKRCFEMKQSAQLVLDHLKCVPPGSLTYLYSVLANSFIESDMKRCESNYWRRHYMDYSRCLKLGREDARVHQCAYKLYDAWKITENMSLADQLPFVCCSMKFVDNCIYNNLYNDCDKQNADFGYYYFWFHSQAMFDKGCPGYKSTKHCQKVYPKEMKKAENIFKSETTLSHRNYFNLLFDVLVKRGRRLPQWSKNVDKVHG